MDVTRYVRTLRRWVWLLVACPLVAVVGSGVVTAFMSPVYEANVSILVKPAQPLASSDPSVGVLTADQISRTYAQLMTERPILDQVANDLGLRIKADDLRKQIKVTPQANTSIISVQVDSTNRRLARDIANKLVDDFVAQTKRIQQQQSEQYTARLQAQIQQVEDSMAPEQATIDRLTRPDRSGTPPVLTPAQQADLAAAQQQLSADRAQYSELVRSLTDIE